MKITVDERELYDLECIYLDLFHPINGFLIKTDYESVVKSCALTSGPIWSLPITLACETIPTSTESVHVMHPEGYVLATIESPEFYTPDIEYECRMTLNTTDDNHPYVQYLKQRQTTRPHYVGGTLIFPEKMPPFHFDFLTYRLSRQQIQEAIKNKPTLGFQTRNPMHKSHFHLTLHALSQTHGSSRLLLTPVVGPTQDGDIDYHVRMKTYIAMLDEYRKLGVDVELCVLPLSMRMAGPREALHHTLIRQNIGCDYFVIGRDHAGPSVKSKFNTPFYHPDAAKTFVASFQSHLKIVVLSCPAIVYSQTKDTYLPITNVEPTDTVLSLSGTEQRTMLSQGIPLPEWYTFPSVSTILSQHTPSTKGIVVYVYGLSGSGKSTFVKSLKSRLHELTSRSISILDGDIVRLHLSKGLGFSKQDRSTNVQRIGFVASQIAYHGGICLCANIAPYEHDRLVNRSLIGSHSHYIEILMNTSLETCEARDTKGLYKLAREGVIKEFTGISDPFEVPEKIPSEFVFNGNADISQLEENMNSVIRTLLRFIN